MPCTVTVMLCCGNIMENKIDESVSDRRTLYRIEDRGLVLSTICDMVLGEDATDRSDDALIRGVRRLLNGQTQD